MSYKSKTQPLCRFCGKPIRKRTTTVYFDRDFGSMARHIKNVRPASREEAQRHVNETIVSVRWDRPKKVYTSELQRGDVLEPRWITQVHVWDCETYEDEFFCNGDHAQSYARAMAMVEGDKHTLQFRAYREALAKRKAGGK